MTNRRMTHSLAVLMAILASLLLVACSSSVVRETSSSSSAQRPVSKPKPGVTVRVQRGDTLYGLAFRNEIDFRALANWNNIGAPYTIYPGQSLRLYPAAGKTASGVTASRPATATRKSAAAATPAARPAPPPHASAP